MWRKASRILLINEYPRKLKKKKKKNYKTTIRPVMLYKSKSLTIKNQHIQKNECSRNESPRWMRAYIIKIEKNIKITWDKSRVTLEDNIRKNRLR